MSPASTLSCPLGHQWPPRGDRPNVCPECGFIVEAPTFQDAPAPAHPLPKPDTLPTAVPVSMAGPSATLATGTPEMIGAPLAVPGYDILGELGRGGMGVVYKARQHGLNRLVALKMVLGGARVGPHEVARFKAEAEAVARVRHPNIVQVYEVGEHEGGPFFSLEYVEGGSLDRRLRGEPQPPGPAAALVETLARAVHAAHQQGVVHRDLKPANILLQRSEAGSRRSEVGGMKSATTDGASPDLRPLTSDLCPKITDFGLAKQIGGESNLTETGAVLGTPSYMAPEQAWGKTREAGPAADVYALGAILYEMLTGRPPFKGATPVDTMLQVVGEEPVPPRRLQPKVPAELETVCLKCLEKDPRKRYASAEALAEDLRRFQAGEPVAARPVGLAGRAAKWARRRPAVAALALLLFLAVTSGLGGVLWQWGVAVREEGRAREQARLAERREEEAKEARGKADANAQTALDQSRRAAAALARAEKGLYDNRIALAHNEWWANRLARAEELLDECPPGLCDWEWRYLKNLCHLEQARLTGHLHAALAAGFTADGKRVVTVDAVNRVRVWDPATGAEVASLPEQLPVVRGALSPDGRQWACCDGTKVVRVWDVATGKEVHALRGHAVKVEAVAYSPDGTRLACLALADRTWQVKVWDLTAGTEVCTLGGDAPPVVQLALGPGNQLACAHADRSLRLWDAATGKEVRALGVQKDGTTALAFRPDGAALAAGDHTGRVTVWDLKAGTAGPALRGASDGVRALAYSGDGAYLAAGGDDTTIRVWKAADADYLFLGPLRGHGDRVVQLAFSPDGKRLVSGATDGTARVWDLAAVRPFHYVGMHRLLNQTVDFSPDGKRLITAAGAVHFWDADQLRLLSAHQDRDVPEVVQRAVFSQDGRFVATCDRGPTVQVRDGTTGQVLRVLGKDGPTVRRVAFRPRGAALLAAGDENGRVRLWDPADGRLVRTLAVKDSGPVADLAFAPDGQRLAVGYGGGGMVRVWDPDRGEEVRALRAPVERLFAVAYSPDGTRLAGAGGFLTDNHMGEVQFWDAATGAELFDLRGHARPVHALAFTPDGRRLATASEDRTCRLWDAQTGQELLTFQGTSHVVEALAFSPDGRRLVTCQRDGSLYAWEAPRRALPRTRPAFVGPVYGVAEAGGRWLAAAGPLGGLKVWDLHGGGEPRLLRGHNHSVNSLAFRADGARLATAGFDNTVRVWDTAAGRELFRLGAPPEHVYTVAYRPDGRRLATARHDGRVRLWDADDGTLTATLEGHGGPVRAVAFGGAGWLASGALDGTVTVWDAAGKVLHTLRGHGGPVMGLAFAGNVLASAGEDGKVKLWDAAAGKELRTLAGHTGAVRAAAFRADGKQLATASEDQTVRLWDVATGRELRVLRGHHRGAMSVAFGGDNLYVGARDGGVYVWDLKLVGAAE